LISTHDERLYKNEDTMKKVVLLSMTIALFPLLLGCLETVRHFERDEELEMERLNWGKIAILPFTGIPAFQRVSGELFSFHMWKQKHFAIIEPAIGEIELKKRGIELSKTQIKIEQAQKAGQILGVDAVIVGSVIIKKGEFLNLGNLVAGVSLTDVSTGKVVATSICSVPIQRLYGEHKVLPEATEGVANDILAILYELAGETWNSPQKGIVTKQE
jgi:hypothetical protein